MHRPTVGIVTPALASANNGNWRTTARWARMLAPDLRAIVLAAWQGEPCDLLIVLHARRGAESVLRWSRSAARDTGRRPPLILVLTGTDLYGDIHTDAQARESLKLADALVVLQDQGLDALPESLRSKAHVIYQSGASRRTLPKPARSLRALMVGHLRAEKDPRTLFGAARLLRERADIRIDHIGVALEPELGRAAESTMRQCPNYRWLGERSHAETLRRIQRAHLLVHASRVEGGAHAILEALCSGTPVLASAIPGNIGMLGAGYEAYFPPGDPRALARWLQRCRDEPDLLDRLRARCRERVPLFDPDTERAALRRLVSTLLEGSATMHPLPEPDQGSS